MKRVLFAISACVLLAACGVSVNKEVLTSYPAERTFSKDDVYVYVATDTIPQHTRIAILSGKGSTQWTKKSQLIDKLREEAGQLGANAIVLYWAENPSAGKKAISALFGKYPSAQGQAIAIYVPSLNKKT